MGTVSRIVRRISHPRMLAVVTVVGLALAAGLATEQFGSAGNNRRANGRRVTRNDVGNAPARSAGDETRRTFDEVIEFAEKSRSAIRDVKDYTAVLTKTELIDGRTIHQSMGMKFRREPFSVYLRCRSKPEAGREVIFIPGENGGKLLAHEAGTKSIEGTLKLE